MAINDVSFDFEKFPNAKDFHFFYKPIHNDSYDISSSSGAKTSKRKVKMEIKESTLSLEGKKKIIEALTAYQKGEVKEFDNPNDLMEELNS